MRRGVEGWKTEREMEKKGDKKHFQSNLKQADVWLCEETRYG